MFLYRGSQYTKPVAYSKRKSRFIDKDFQVKYTLVVVGAAALGMIVSVAPLYYFLHENYQIFVDLAYDHAPELLDHLEREKGLIHTLLAASFAGLFFFFSLLGLRMTSRIVGPLRVLRNHLKLLSRGHWAQNNIKVRDDDEFQDLIEAYNYFYSAFRVNLRRDLDLLKKMSVDPNNRDAYMAWKQLIEEKAIQLQLSSELIDPQPLALVSKPKPSPDSRHAS